MTSKFSSSPQNEQKVPKGVVYIPPAPTKSHEGRDKLWNMDNENWQWSIHESYNTVKLGVLKVMLPFCVISTSTNEKLCARCAAVHAKEEDEENGMVTD